MVPGMAYRVTVRLCTEYEDPLQKAVTGLLKLNNPPEKIFKLLGLEPSMVFSILQRLVDMEVIEEIDFDGYVYDVCCESPHLYITNNFISHNCILWIDEIEKGIGGVQSSNQTDGGVTNRLFGTLLTWMQEKEDPVFVIATANNVNGIPPEFLRAGRFDEMFFLDLPDQEQRKEVFACLLKNKQRNPKDFDINKLATISEHYSPAELEKGINNALFIAYANKRTMVDTDIVNALGEFMPLYNTRHEEIEEMRNWALGEAGKGGRARLANSTKAKSFLVKDLGRQIDVDIDENGL